LKLSRCNRRVEILPTAIGVDAANEQMPRQRGHATRATRSDTSDTGQPGRGVIADESDRDSCLEVCGRKVGSLDASLFGHANFVMAGCAFLNGTTRKSGLDFDGPS
jgi:hypothetical protein